MYLFILNRYMGYRVQSEKELYRRWRIWSCSPLAVRRRGRGFRHSRRALNEGKPTCCNHVTFYTRLCAEDSRCRRAGVLLVLLLLLLLLLLVVLLLVVVLLLRILLVRCYSSFRSSSSFFFVFFFFVLFYF